MGKIAIVGMSCLFPGASTPDEFWQNLVKAKSSQTEVTEQELGIPLSECYTKEPQPNKIYSLKGGFIRDFTFDSAGYHLPENQLEKLDDVFQWSLHVSREALKDSGLWQMSHSLKSTGVILGNYTFPTKSSNKLVLPGWREKIKENLGKHFEQPLSFAEHQEVEEQVSNRYVCGYPTSIVAQACAMDGPQFAIDAACSSALYAIKLAAYYLESGRANAMVAGGVCAPDPWLIHTSFSDLKAYPQNGMSIPFEKSSSGIQTSQGAGAVVLKRLDDALADGDHIYCVIEACGLSNDGAGKHLLSPNPQGQILAYERAFKSTDLTCQDIDYIECHATGTPLGDQTELNSLEEFFGEQAKIIKLGSVKGNTGHLLTVAGLTSLMKLILSLQNQQLVATLNINDPRASQSKFITKNNIVTQNQQWESRQGSTKNNRVAGVSAFGFGGTNAHLIISDILDKNFETNTISSVPVSIVGMGAHFGPITSISRFEEVIFNQETVFSNRDEVLKKGFDPSRSKVSFVKDVEISPLDLKIPPAELEQFNHQQLLMLNVANETLLDAGLNREDCVNKPRNIAVILVIELDLKIHLRRARAELPSFLESLLSQNGLEKKDVDFDHLLDLCRESILKNLNANEVLSYIGNIMASKISSIWNLSGASFTLSGDGNGVPCAMDVAQLMLSAGDVEGVLVGAVDMMCKEEELEFIGPNQVPWHTDSETVDLGEGAGCVLLMRDDIARKNQFKRYATFKKQIYHPDSKQNTAVVEKLKELTNTEAVEPSQIGLIDLTAFSDSAFAESELEWVKELASGAALSNTSSIIGYTRVAAPIASLIKTSLCLYHRYVPATKRWPKKQKSLLEQWKGEEVHLPIDSYPWFKQKDRPRHALVSSISSNRSIFVTLLEEAGWPDESGVAKSTLPIFPIVGCDEAELSTLITKYLAGTNEGNYDEHRTQAIEKLKSAGKDDRVMLIVAESIRDLLSEFKLAAQHLDKNHNESWKTPKGSFYAAHRIPENSGVSFVYPGGFNSYPALANGLFRLFPQLLRDLDSDMDDGDAAMASRWLYPKSAKPLSVNALIKNEQQMLQDIPAMLSSGTSLAILYTRLLQSYLKVSTDVAFGYSLGETSMLFANNVWPTKGRSVESLTESSLFQDVLTGRRTLVRDSWQLSDDLANSKVWGSVAVIGDLSSLHEKVIAFERVYITHINSQKEAVLAGEPESLKLLCDQLDVDVVKMPVAHVLHCEVMRSCEAQLADLNRYPSTSPQNDVKFISAHTYDVIEDFERDSLASANADSLCRMVNFPALMEKAYSLGARFFIEVGPGGTCSRWLRDYFEEREVAVASVVQRGQTDIRSFTQLVVQLLGHRIPVDVNWLFPNVKNTEKPPSMRQVNIADWRFMSGLESSLLTLRKRPKSTDELTAQNTVKTKKIIHRSQGETKREKVQEKPIFENNNRSVMLQKNKFGKPELPKVPVTSVQHIDANPNPKKDKNMYELSDQNNIDVDQKQKDKKYLLRLNDVHLKYINLQSQLQNHIFNQAQCIANSYCIQSGVRAVNAPEELTLPSDVASLSHKLEIKNPVIPVHKSKQSEALFEETSTRVAETGAMNESQLLNFASGKISDAFGPEYSEIDNYPVRVRLPSPPYFFVSRVTRIKAEKGKYEPCMLTTEYDIPKDAWYLTDGVMPPGVAVEAGQSDLLLISYLGIDFENKGDRVYRLLDGELVFVGELPRAGQVLKFDIYIDSFVRQNGMLLFFFRYDGYVDGQLALQLKRGCAGFFTQQELKNGQGVIQNSTIKKTKLVKPVLNTARRSLNRDDLSLLSKGELNAVFGEGFKSTPKTDGLRLPPEKLLMIDSVTLPDFSNTDDIIVLEAFKELDPNGWYFKSHFVDDPVLPGSLVAEGATQMLKIYLLGVGFSQCFAQGELQALSGALMSIKVRGQITPDIRHLRYEVKIFESGFLPRPYVRANVTVYSGEKAMVLVENLGLCLKEKHGHVPYPRYKQPDYHSGRVLEDGSSVILNEFHLAHASKGHLKTALGEEFGVYDNIRAPYFPNGDFQFVDRAVSITGDDGDDIVGASLITEYDSPKNAWYYKENSSPFMPNCVYLETALQASILLGYYRGATLPYPDKEFSIRNLDGHATYYKDVDTRGKTIRHKETLLSSTSLNGSVIQNYHFVLTADEETIYEGESMFGFFTKNALATQIGLDKGEVSEFWYEKENVSLSDAIEFNEKGEFEEELFENKKYPNYCLSRNKLNLLHRGHIVQNGGKYSKGYIHAYREIFSDDWYFDCHFHKDPVMPGSLGIEAILQGLYCFAIKNEIGLSKFNSPRFSIPENVTTKWKYRGQILRSDSDMYIEAHIKSIEEYSDKIVIIADADLFNDRLRIYELEDMAIVIKEMDL